MLMMEHIKTGHGSSRQIVHHVLAEYPAYADRNYFTITVQSQQECYRKSGTYMGIKGGNGHRVSNLETPHHHTTGQG